MIVNRGGDTYSTRLGEALEARSEVNTCPVKIAAHRDDIAEINPDAQLDCPRRKFGKFSKP